jgi:hypothetical protein
VALSGDTQINGDAVTLDVQSGSLSLRENTRLQADVSDLKLRVRGGNFSAQGSSNLLAARDVVMDVGGQLSLSQESTLSAGQDIRLNTQAGLQRGDVAFSQATTLSAARDIAMDIVGGHFSASGGTHLSAGDDIDLHLSSGDVRLGNASTFQAADVQAIRVDAGNIALSGLTALTGGNDLALQIGSGHLSFADTTTLTATANDLAITLGTGNVSLTGDSTLKAGTDQTLTVGSGNVNWVGLSTVQAGTTFNLVIGTGDFSTAGTTRIGAGELLSAHVERGNARFVGDTELRSQGDVSLGTGEGDIDLTQRSEVIAEDAVQIYTRRAGHFVMADAQTRISAGTLADVRTVGDVRIDLIEAGAQVNLVSLAGSVLDNTLAETDLVLAPSVYFSAMTGIGLPWVDNLNIQADVVEALNTGSVGINLQNRQAVTVGERSVVNTGTGDVVLIAGGNIHQTAIHYGSAGAPAGSVSNLTGQKIYLLGNQSPADLASQIGNHTPTSTSSIIVKPSNQNLADLFRAPFIPSASGDVMGDAFAHDGAQDGRTFASDLVQPIRVNAVLGGSPFSTAGAMGILDLLDLRASVNLLAPAALLGQALADGTPAGGLSAAPLADPLSTPLLTSLGALPLSLSVTPRLPSALPADAEPVSAPEGARAPQTQNPADKAQASPLVDVESPTATQDILSPAVRASLRQVLQLADDGIDRGILSGMDLPVMDVPVGPASASPKAPTLPSETSLVP